MTVFKLFIGGPSQAGKSTTAKLVCDITGYAHLNLDRDQQIIQIKKDLQGAARSAPLKMRCKVLIQKTHQNSVVEGSPLKPEDVRNISGQDVGFVAAFCGYPNVDAEDKMAQLETSGFRNAQHLRNCSAQDRLARIAKYIRASQKLQDECAALSLPFFDYSNLSTLSEKQTEMADYFQSEIKKLSPP